LQKRIAKAVAS